MLNACRFQTGDTIELTRPKNAGPERYASFSADQAAFHYDGTVPAAIIAIILANATETDMPGGGVGGYSSTVGYHNYVTLYIMYTTPWHSM